MFQFIGTPSIFLIYWKTIIQNKRYYEAIVKDVLLKKLKLWGNVKESMHKKSFTYTE